MLVSRLRVPQGSVLGLLEFTAFTGDITDLLNRSDTRSHLYADDTQPYASCRPEDMDTVRTRLSRCTADTATRCASRCLQLNANKTEVIWFGSRVSLAKFSGRDCAVPVGSELIQPPTVVRDLGVHFDAKLNMKRHVAPVVAACFYHLRRIRQNGSDQRSARAEIIWPGPDRSLFGPARFQKIIFRPGPLHTRPSPFLI